ncbi:MAG TPA: Wzz/FepE/Etk N-terminal domain-containing protein [Frankiaceae bacterium]|jgi:capsular polysaccharide biosynthesis protein|nr:Wzz/FepE/Etk N-terminal domain-containing protein [Frankiaceae bacterium]
MSSVPHSSGLAAASARSTSDQGPTSLSDYGNALMRRWWLVLLGLLVGGAVAAGYLNVVHKSYTSTATVQVTDTGVSDSSVPAASRNNTANVDMDTEAAIVTSNTVASLAANGLHTNLMPSQLADKVKVTVPPNSAVLAISFHAGNALDARAGAQVFANSYLSNRASIANGLVAAELKSLQDQLPALNKQLADITGQIAILPTNSPTRALAEAQQSIVTQQINTINSAINPLLQQRVTAGRLLSPANLPTAASSPKRSLVLLSGILGGLLLGAVLALVAVRRDRRIHSAAEITHRVGLPVLAELSGPVVKSLGQLNAEFGGAAPVRELRDRLVAGGVARSVLVVPLSAGAGGSLVAVNLAASLSADGSSCSLVCASPDSVSPLRLRIPSAPGLSDALAFGFTDVRATLTHLNDQRLGVLPPGRQPKALLDRLHGNAMLDLVRDLRKHYDHVVVEAPVWTSTRSALVLGRGAEAVILVAESRLTTRDEVLEAGQMLTDSGVPVLGVVMVPRLRGTGLSGDAARAGQHAAKGGVAPDGDGATTLSVGSAGAAGSSPNVR